MSAAGGWGAVPMGLSYLSVSIVLLAIMILLSGGLWRGRLGPNRGPRCPSRSVSPMTHFLAFPSILKMSIRENPNWRCLIHENKRVVASNDQQGWRKRDSSPLIRTR
jgi:hypothetical protein